MPTESAVPLFPPVYETVQKFGRHPDMGNTDTNEEVWDDGSAYSYPAAAATMTVSSSSAADTSTGTGARTVRVFGLNSSYQEVIQDVTLTGQTGVAMSTDLIRVYRAYAITVGSGGVNAGDVWVGTGTVTNGVPANKYAGILTGNGQTLMAIYTIPASDSAGTTYAFGRIIRWYASVGAVASPRCQIALQTRELNESWRTRRVIGVSAGGPWEEMLTWGIDVGTKADVRLLVLDNGVANTTIEAGFDIALGY
jgi:hypothetical protein